jgi:uncharacterized protein YecE (DUF72 family)
MSDWSPIPAEEPALPPVPAPARGPLPARARPWEPLVLPPDTSSHGLFVGTAGWDFDDWAGRFYPPRGGRRGGLGSLPVTPQAGAGRREWFAFYQLYFSFLEINHTFYEEPTLRHFLELDRRSKPGMRFSVKAHRNVSHKGLWDPEEGKALMRRHAEAVAPLVESGRFFSFLIQLDDRRERSRKVLDYLLAAGSAAVGLGCDVHVEFRHRTWHQEPVLRALQDAGLGICNTEIPALPHVFPRRAYATTAKGYVRYCGLNAAAWGDPPEGTRPPGPRDRMKAMDARYDYRYGAAELETRVREQARLLAKTDATAVVFKNHARAQAAVNAAENLAVFMELVRRRKP